MTTSSPRRKVAILSLSTIEDDPRVQRYARTLIADGWQVTTVGFGEAGAGRHWVHRPVPELPYESGVLARGVRICGLVTSRAIPVAALWTWRRQARHAALLRAVADLTTDLVIACDHVSLPAAMALAVSVTAPLVYDSHEFAVREKEEDLVWRILYPPYIRAIERSGLAQAAGAITVSEGIASAMAEEYRLASAPAVIRNFPVYRAMPFRPPKEHLIVHHHGALVPDRGLELLIRSVSFWQPRFNLRLRGPIAADYESALRALIERCGVGNRVTIAPPLPMESLIADAWEADIGIHLLPDFGTQNRFALPNKLFEFLMAGLAVVTSDLPEMRRIVDTYGVGLVVPNTTAESVAGMINMLDTDRIVAFKRAALDAARSLCWEAEEERFLSICGAVVDQPNLGARNVAALSETSPS